MARALWSGSLTFGLVNIPVQLFPATSDHDVRFHQFERGTSDRIRYRRVNERTGKEVRPADIVKGYELSRDHYVMIDEAEIGQIAPQRSHSIDITAFVKQSGIDPIYYDRSYYLAPDKKQFASTYALLLHAMAKADRCGIASFVLRGRAHLVAIRATKAAIVATTLHYADEVLAADNIVGELPKTSSAKEIAAARMLIDTLETPWNPSDYEDTYERDLAALLAAKAEGSAPVAVESAEAAPTNVIDLMAALQESIDRAKVPAQRSTRRRKAASAK